MGKSGRLLMAVLSVLAVFGASAATAGATSNGPTSVYYVTERGNEGIAKITVDSAGTHLEPGFVTGLPASGPDSVIFDHKGQMLVSNTDVGNIWRIDPGTGKPDAGNPVNKSSLQAGNPNGTIDGVADLALDPKSDTVWAIGWDRSVLAKVDLVTGLTTFVSNDLSRLGGITFSSSGRLFVSSHNGVVYELNPQSGAVVRSDSISGAEASPDGMTFDTTSGDIFAAGCDGICEFTIGTAAAPTLSQKTIHTGTDGDGIAADGHGHILIVGNGTLKSLDLKTGDIATIASNIPSSDDVAPVIGAGAPPAATIGLTPATATHTVGQTTTVTATLTDVNGNPVQESVVTLKVSGANPGTFTATTDANGKATFTYAGRKAGTDTLVASAGDAQSNAATVIWTAAATPAPSVPVLAQTGRGGPASGSILMGLAAAACLLGAVALLRRPRRPTIEQ